LANELRLREKSSLIQIKKAAVVRLVIKKRNVPRSDASNQVNEQDLIIKQYSTNTLNNQKLHFLQLENQNVKPFQQQFQ